MARCDLCARDLFETGGFEFSAPEPVRVSGFVLSISVCSEHARYLRDQLVANLDAEAKGQTPPEETPSPG